MRFLNKMLLVTSLSLGFSAQAGSDFSGAFDDFPPIKKVMLILAKKCQIDPQTVQPGWYNSAISQQPFQAAVVALQSGDQAGYRAALSQMHCPIEKDGKWLFQ